MPNCKQKHGYLKVIETNQKIDYTGSLDMNKKILTFKI
jgi:hypothetical protein